MAYPLTHPDRHCKGQTVNRASPSNSNDAKQQAKGVWCHRPSPEVEVEGSESQGHSQPHPGIIDFAIAAVLTGGLASFL